jgi:hypothetical protein
MLSNNIEYRHKIINEASSISDQLPEKQFKNILEAATSQFTSARGKIPEVIRHHTCGITSPYMAVKLLGLENNFSSDVPLYEEFIWEALGQTIITLPCTYLEEKIGGKVLNIPIYYSNEDLDVFRRKSFEIANSLGIDQNLVKESKKLDQPSRVRGFSINTGWDTGGTSILLKRIGLSKHLKIETRSKFNDDLMGLPDNDKISKLKDELTNELRYANALPNIIKKVASVSINTNTPGWKRYYGNYAINYNYTKHTVQSHVVLLIGIISDMVLFMDPAGKKQEDIIQYMHSKDFLSAYNGIHTLFSLKNC